MRLSLVALALSLVCNALINPGEVPLNNHEDFTYLVIQIDPTLSLSPIDVAHGLGLKYVGPVGELGNQGYHQVAQTKKSFQRLASSHRRDNVLTDAQVVERHFAGHPAVNWVEVQVPRKISLRQVVDSVETPGIQQLRQKYDIKDPEFAYQWHIFNEAPGQVGHDHNISAAWAQGVFGKGSVVAVVDDGLFYESKDLADNYFAEGSFDFIRNIADPAPYGTVGGHGTNCAGEIAAVKNSVCGVGVAYQAKVSGIRLYDGTLANTNAFEAAAMNYKYQQNHIYSNSWGPSDDGMTMEKPSTLFNEALKNGVKNGRGGLGSIFVFAGGNGGYNGDSCAFDGYINSIYTISVGSLDRSDNQPKYGEDCPAKMISIPSGSGDQCSRTLAGTSFAAPIASGIFALVNSIRPDLTWRDYQHLSIKSAVVVNPSHPSWFKTASGRPYSPTFGYGKLDAGRILDLARTWVSVGNANTFIDSPRLAPNVSAIPQEKNKDLRVIFKINDADKQAAGFSKLEHVVVTVWIDHQRRGDVYIDLISPTGVVSNICVGRPDDDDATGFQGWELMSLAHWDEEVIGAWTVAVSDRVNPQTSGMLRGVAMRFYGSLKDGSSLPTNSTSSSSSAQVNNTAPVTSTIKSGAAGLWTKLVVGLTIISASFVY
ncbi:subtilisin-like protein [Rhizoclosmatium globosum]|uniref:Subtilisin-like protein n=1 Tax=Rhizoclosmatium globosum TaxID=329046 RepID=A0A1Y2C9E8_9FUNG|nr:subtilisin-like protein [Rhizoclosmatium globosum]|eukprot:ORY43661.1 subtilisin-like protein [Rhizoclosmatium globosum]